MKWIDAITLGRYKSVLISIQKSFEYDTENESISPSKCEIEEILEVSYRDEFRSLSYSELVARLTNLVYYSLLLGDRVSHGDICKYWSVVSYELGDKLMKRGFVEVERVLKQLVDFGCDDGVIYGILKNTGITEIDPLARHLVSYSSSIAGKHAYGKLDILEIYENAQLPKVEGDDRKAILVAIQNRMDTQNPEGVDRILRLFEKFENPSTNLLWELCCIFQDTGGGFSKFENMSEYTYEKLCSVHLGVERTEEFMERFRLLDKMVLNPNTIGLNYRCRELVKFAEVSTEILRDEVVLKLLSEGLENTTSTGISTFVSRLEDGVDPRMSALVVDGMNKEIQRVDILPELNKLKFEEVWEVLCDSGLPPCYRLGEVLLTSSQAVRKSPELLNLCTLGDYRTIESLLYFYGEEFLEISKGLTGDEIMTEVIQRLTGLDIELIEEFKYDIMNFLIMDANKYTNLPDYTEVLEYLYVLRAVFNPVDILWASKKLNVICRAYGSLGAERFRKETEFYIHLGLPKDELIAVFNSL